MFSRIPVYIQHDSSECGPTTLRIVARYYGREFGVSEIVRKTKISRNGISLLTLSRLAERMGFRSRPVKASEELLEEAPAPFIAHWSQNHFVVVFKVGKRKVIVVDPAIGKIEYSREEFVRGWAGENASEGVLLLLEATDRFFEVDRAADRAPRTAFVAAYLSHYRKYYVSLVVGMIVVGILSIGFPVLTSILIDFGVSGGNMQLIVLILVAQLMLFVGRSAAEFIRNWTLLYVGSRTSISMEADFIEKLLRQPLSFFESRAVGDVLQRLDDHRRIENFLTHGTLNTIFSIVVFVMYGVVLAVYSAIVTSVFILGTALAIAWVVLFMKKQRECDQRLFRQIAENQETVVQMHRGIQDLKIMLATRQKRWEWEQSRSQQFRLTVRQQRIRQLQSGGMLFLNEGKNILAIYFAAVAVLNGDMTVGMMLAVAYVVGQMNGPLTQLTWALLTSQEAQTSVDRVRDFGVKESADAEADIEASASVGGDIVMSSIDFSYEEDGRTLALQGVSCVFPASKITALVGASGCGKSTLLKILLKLYEPKEGSVRIGQAQLNAIATEGWYRQTTAVLQDSYLFPESFAKNIALDESEIDYDRVAWAARLACASEFVERLPYSYNTKLGANGHGLSEGQKQRILIARAIYRRPAYLFLDEATNALDATTENKIVHNITSELAGCTVILIAHRLSIIRRAEHIIMMRAGGLVSEGTHESLLAECPVYYELIRDQLVIEDERATG